MLSFIKNLFGAKPAVEVKDEAPYKVPEPVGLPVAGLMFNEFTPVDSASTIPVKVPVVKAKAPARAKKPRTPKAK